MLLMILQPIIIALIATFLFGCPPKYEELDNKSLDVSSRREHLGIENPGYGVSLNYFYITIDIN